MDLTQGPILKNMLAYSLPVMFAALLQVFYNAADTAVVGKFAYNGEEAMAAVGATSALNNLIINILTGLSVGATAIVARYYGAKQDKEVSDAVHTTMGVGLLGGILIGVFGYFTVRVWLHLMGTPDSIISLSVQYCKIIFIGLPFSMVFNFGASILRAVGDTKRPLYILALSGIVNVVFNIFFVTVFNWSVEGVAVATVISQALSACLVVLSLTKNEGSLKYFVSKTYLHRKQVLEIFRIGFPTAIQGSMFSLSNVLIQSTVNTFGEVAMAGNTVACNLGGFVYTSFNAYNHASLAFAGQNYGAREYNRLYKIVRHGMFLAGVSGFLTGMLVWILGNPLMSFYTDSTEIMKWGNLRNQVVCTTYFICGMQEVLIGYLRGLGESLKPALISLFCICGLRVAWIYTAVPIFRAAYSEQASFSFLYVCYPITWIVILVALYFLYKHKKKELKKEQAEFDQKNITALSSVE